MNYKSISEKTQEKYPRNQAKKYISEKGEIKYMKCSYYNGPLSSNLEVSFGFSNLAKGSVLGMRK
jgi:hypothetical protein